MKNCPYCKIEVGGNLKKCPLCNSSLSGEAERNYFPKQTTLKLKSFFYKLQLFIVFAIIIVALGMEFTLDIRPFDSTYWSLIVTMWLIAFEYGIMRLFKRGFHASRVLTMFVIIVTLLGMVTAYQIGYLGFMCNWIVPIIITGTLIANFILAMIDQISNAMVYLLTNVAVGIIPYIVLYFVNKNIPMTWIICLLVSIILFVGAIIFKGRAVVTEIQKRLNI